MKRIKSAPAVPRRRILRHIADCFEQIMQDHEDVVDRAEHHGRYAERAEELICLLEAFDCGSVGNFDRENPDRAGDARLWRRFCWLLAKYGNDLRTVHPRSDGWVEELDALYPRRPKL